MHLYNNKDTCHKEIIKLEYYLKSMFNIDTLYMNAPAYHFFQLHWSSLNIEQYVHIADLGLLNKSRERFSQRDCVAVGI
jgi:hypothetical protein